MYYNYGKIHLPTYLPTTYAALSWQDVADRWSCSVKYALELMKRVMLVKATHNFPKEILGGKSWRSYQQKMM